MVRVINITHLKAITDLKVIESNPDSPPASDAPQKSDSDKPYLESRQYALIDPADLKQPISARNANDFGWVLGKLDAAPKLL
jgi:hypothetical protein